METCFKNFSIQWKHVSGTFPHNGNMIRVGFPWCGKGFHGVEKPRPTRLVGGERRVRQGGLKRGSEKGTDPF